MAATQVARAAAREEREVKVDLAAKGRAAAAERVEAVHRRR